MKSKIWSHLTQERMPLTTEEWCTLNKTLLSHIRYNLCKYNTTHWMGSEQELAEDVLQETYTRVLHFAQSDEDQECTPLIKNFEALCKTIATRYILDLRRKDKRLVGSLDNTKFSITHETISMSDDPATLAVEDITLYTHMFTFSQIVKRFPDNLARSADFDDEYPRPLERAMWSVGISLREYYCELPHDPILRSRHNALVCLAYRRLRLAFNTTLSPLNAAA